MPVSVPTAEQYYQQLSNLSLVIADRLAPYELYAHEAFRLKECHHPLLRVRGDSLAHYCESTFCFACMQRRRELQRRALVEKLSAQSVQPSQVLMGTFTLQNAQITDVRASARLLSKNFSHMLNHNRRDVALKHLAGTCRMIELVPAPHSYSNSQNIHLHSVLVMDSSFGRGRDYIRKRELKPHFQQLWRDALASAGAGNAYRDADCQVAQSIEAVGSYVVKSSVGHMIQQAEAALALPVYQMLELHEQMRGVRRLQYTGSLRGRPVGSEQESAKDRGRLAVERLAA